MKCRASLAKCMLRCVGFEFGLMFGSRYPVYFCPQEDGGIYHVKLVIRIVDAHLAAPRPLYMSGQVVPPPVQHRRVKCGG